jgi:hypothetical protein
VDPYPDPGGQKLSIKIEKIMKFRVLKCWMFGHQNPGFGSGSVFSLKMMDPDPDQMNKVRITYLARPCEAARLD